MNINNRNLSKPNLNAGVIDLSTLGAKPVASASSPYIVDVTEATFEAEVMIKSTQVSVIVDLWADWCGPCKQLTPILEKLVIEFDGKMVLAKIDTEANPQVAAAFQVQSIPAVFLILNGQVQQLFNGAYPEPQVRSVLEQVLDVAAKTFGQEVASPNLLAEPEAEPEKPIDPRFVKAFDAMEAGEWDTAEVVFKEALLNAPADEEAKIGVIQVGLFKRTDGVDFDKVIGKSLDNHETYLEVADSLMMLGQLNAALDLLISGIKNFAGEERDEIKQRLLDFFVLIGDSEEVRTARRNLTNALF
ncbi:MAG: hypothetical protein RLZZ330_193 [Actinomycetota bacterium]|jgi:putative thioredoxin